MAELRRSEGLWSEWGQRPTIHLGPHSSRMPSMHLAVVAVWWYVPYMAASGKAMRRWTDKCRNSKMRAFGSLKTGWKFGPLWSTFGTLESFWECRHASMGRPMPYPWNFWNNLRKVHWNIISPSSALALSPLKTLWPSKHPWKFLKPFDLEIVKNMSLRNSWTLSAAVLESKTLFDLKLVREPLKILIIEFFSLETFETLRCLSTL